MLANKMRQISLSVLAIESNRDKVPLQFDRTDGTTLPTQVLAHLGYNIYETDSRTLLPEYVNDLDPSYAYYATRPDGMRPGTSSFAFNHLVFDRLTSLNAVTDGLSNTFMSSERYARCGKRANVHWGMAIFTMLDAGGGVIAATNYDDRTATFSDRHYDDILPVFDPATRTSHGSVPGLTFQSLPRPDVCDPRILQSSTTSGLIVALMDGSVRTISPAVAPAVYWSSMTPDKGEVVSLD